MARAAVLIDGGYFDAVLLNYGKLSVDYEAYSDFLCEGYERFRTYYYHCMPYQSPTPTEEEREKFSSMRRFVNTLKRKSRFEVRLGKVVKYGTEPPHQKQVDALLAIDLVRLAAKGHVSKAVLIAGDADHVPAVSIAKEEGVIVSLYYLGKTVDGDYPTSRELYDLCDERVEITRDMLLAYQWR